MTARSRLYARQGRVRKLRLESLEDRCPTGGLPLAPTQPLGAVGIPDAALLPPAGENVGGPTPGSAESPEPRATGPNLLADSRPVAEPAAPRGKRVDDEGRSGATRPAGRRSGPLDLPDLSVPSPPVGGQPRFSIADNAPGGGGGVRGGQSATDPGGHAGSEGPIAPARTGGGDEPAPVPTDPGPTNRSNSLAPVVTGVPARPAATHSTPPTGSAGGPVAAPATAADIPEPSPPAAPAPGPRSGTARIGFNHTDLDGWAVKIEGGTADGRGSVRPGSAWLEEGNSFRVGLERSFIVPANPAPLVFTYSDLSFDTTDPASINDAFEASLVGPDGRPLVHSFTPGRDSFFNVSEDVGLATGAGTAEAGSAVRTVTVDLSDVPAGTAATARFRLVNNDRDTGTKVRILDVLVPSDTAPTAAITGDTTGVPGQDRAFWVSATDPDPADRAAGFTFQVAWGDGTTTTVLPGQPLALTHAFPAPAAYQVSVTATDVTGATSDPVIHAVTITPVAIQPDVCDPTRTVLAVGGTPGADQILFKKGAVAGQVLAVVNGTTYGPFTPTGRVFAFGQGGADALSTGNVPLASWLYGGAGNDTLTGGSQSDLLLGGDGADRLVGNSGRDLFLGGTGADSAEGGAGDELLVGGTTKFDTSPGALCGIQHEWTSGRTFLQRVKNLRGEPNTTFGDRLNGLSFLTAGLAATVFADAEPDDLHGQDGNCWFLADLDPGAARDSFDFGGADVVEDVDPSGAGGPGPVAAYNFDAGSGATLPDVSGRGHDGQIAGATWSGAGKSGGALSFDGVDDWVTVADAADLDLTTGMTLEAWVKPAVVSGWQTAVLKEGASASAGLSYALYGNDPGVNRPAAFVNTGHDNLSAAGTAKLAANAWAHLAVTYDGLTLRLYVNGAEVRSKAVAEGLLATAGPLRLGGNAVWGEFFKGLIDDVRVYDRALTPGEVRQDMGTPVAAVAGGTKFFVVDPTADATFRYGPTGPVAGAAGLDATVGNVRGVASNAAGDTLWVIDGSTKQVTVLGADGAARGSWTAGGLATPQDIATDGADLWVVDAGTHQVLRYAAGVRNIGGTVAPSDAFALHSDNLSPTGLATDGTFFWVTDDVRDAVFVYTRTGSFEGRWSLDPANADASGVTLDPTGASLDLWVVDRGDARVYRYAGGRTWRDGARAAADGFALAVGNGAPEGIADPPITDPNDPRNWLGATVGTFAALYFGADTPANRQQVVDAGLLDDGRFDATAAVFPATLLPTPWAAGGVSTGRSLDTTGTGSFDYVLGGNVFTAANRVDDLWIQSSGVVGDTVFDLGAPASRAAVFNTIDHGPLPQEAIESTVYLSNDRVTWRQAVVQRVWLEGFHPILGIKWDGFVYAVGTGTGETFRYASVIHGGPGALINDGDDEINGLLGLTDDFAPVTPEPPSITVVSPAASAAVAPGRVLVTGRAAADLINVSPGRQPNGITLVTVNGRPVDVLDATGTFFAHVDVGPGQNVFDFETVDAYGQAATTRLTLNGVSGPSGPDFSLFSDVSGSLAAEYGRTSFDAAAEILYADLAVRNAGTYPADAPLLVGVRNISDPTVRVRSADGTTPDGVPYYDFSSLVIGGTLAPGGVTASRAISFHNPAGGQFTYELVFLGQLNRAPEIGSVPDVEALAGRAYRYDVDATDPDSDPLTYSLPNAPASMSIDPTSGLITWSPEPDDVGIQSVVVRVTDGRGGSAEQTYALGAMTPPPNRPPVVTSVPVVEAAVNAPYAYDVDASDADGDTLTYSAPPQTTASISVANPSFETQALGEGGYVTGSATGWTVVGDAGPYHPPSYMYSGGTVADGNNVLYVNGPPYASGASVSQILTSVLEPNTRYDLGVKVGHRSDLGQPGYTIQLLAGDTVVAQDSSEQPAPGAFASALATYTTAPADPLLGRPLQIRLLATSGQPHFDDVRLTATDTYALPAGMTIDPATGFVQWTPVGGQLGDHEVRVEVVDGRGGTARQTFTVRVSPDPANSPPVILSQPATEFEVLRTAGPQVTGGIVETGDPGLGSIRGQKFLDIDGDGVRDVSGQIGSLITLAPMGPVILGPNDDGSSGLNPFGFTFNFFGQAYDQFYVNNNGNITFTSPFGAYSASGFPAGLPIIAPFWADVDTRGAGSGLVRLARGTSVRNNPFVQIDWPDVGYYPGAVDKLNDFTLYIEDDPTGDIIFFAYRNMEWTTGSASGGSGGFGGTPAQLGFDAGDGTNFRSLGRPSTPADLAPFNNTSFIFRIDPAGTPLPFAEPGLDGWTIQLSDAATGRVVASQVTRSLDLDGNGRIDPASEQGVYRFENLPAGTYVVREEGQPGWVQSVPAAGTYTIPVAAGTRAEGRDFGNYRTYTYPVAAVDPDGDTLTYRVDTGPAGAAIDPATGALSWFTTTPGSYHFRVGVEDGRGGRASQEFDLTVRDPSPNVPPEFTSTPTTQTGPGHRYRYPAAAHDSNGDPLVYDLTEAPDGMTVHPQTGAVIWDPTADQLGTHVVRVRAQDGGGDVSQEFTVTVSVGYVNGAPGFTSVPPATATATRLFRYQPTAADPDGDLLTYELLVGPAGMNVDQRFGTVVWVPSREQVGTHAVILRVRDAGGASAIQSFDVNTVTPNGGPVITSTPPTRAAVGQAYRYLPQAQDPEGDELTFRLDLAPAGMSIDLIHRAVIEWTPGPEQTGPQAVVLTVIDAGGVESSQSFQIQVSATAENTPPVITSTPRSAVGLGGTYRYQAAVADPDPDPLAFELITAPNGMVISPDGLITWVPGPSAIGPNPVVLRVSDGRGGVAEQSVTVTVTAQPINGPPVVTSTPPAAVVLGRAYRYDARGTDPDGDPLVWALDQAPAGMSVDPQTGAVRWSPAPDQLGTHGVVLVAADGQGGTATQTFDVDVRAVNTPPAVTSTPPTQAAVGRAYGYAVRATDPDGDPLVFSVAGPANMAVDPVTGALTWTPTAAQTGVHEITVVVGDGQAVATQTFDVEVLGTAVNLPPAITSTPSGRAVVGSLYEYRVAGTDPDGQPLTFSLGAHPDGMTIDPATGAVTWTPQPEQTQPFTVTVRATDPAGAYAQQTFTLRAAANAAPVISRTPAPPAAAVVGKTYRYDVRATDPEGQPLTYTLPDAPAGMAVDALGRITWTPADDQVGPHTVTVRVADPLGAADTFTFTATAVADTLAPRVTVQVSQNSAPVGSSVTVVVTATDDVAVVARGLTVNGVPLVLDSAGRATVPAAVVGDLVFAATAIDPSGNVGTAAVTVTVFDPSDVDGPEVDLTGPAEDAVLNAPTDVTGSVTDDNLLYYTLSIAPVGSDVFTEIVRRTTPVSNGVLGRLDPSVLQNDAYVLRLFAKDAGGNEAVIDRVISVAGDLKLGNFTLSFTDLTVPVQGVPITVTRTYDSFAAGRADELGFGWRLEFRDTDLRTSVEPTGLEDDLIYNPFRTGTRVYVTLPGGKREGFTFRPKLAAGLRGRFLGIYEAEFVPDAGVFNTLSVEPFDLAVFSDGTVGSYGGGLPYNPASGAFGGRYFLTTKDGLVYTINGNTGDLDTVADLNGNTLTFGDDAIVSSAGPEVRFERDPRGRIAAVVDPAGNRVRYAYDLAGDLVAVTDREANVTRFEYAAPGRAHYLTKVTDPLGRAGVRTEYDAQGRLVKLIDATGQAVDLVHDPANSVEVVRDQLGNPTTYEYDARGNVVREVDAEGGVTERTYDLSNNTLTETVILANGTRLTTAMEYDGLGNMLTETDPLGNVTRYTYQTIRPRTALRVQLAPVSLQRTVTDPLGNTTTNDYDAVGNLLSTTDPAGVVTAFAYDAVGNPTTLTANGGTTSFTYDGAGRVLTQTDAGGRVTAYTYDAAGNQLTATTTLTTPAGVRTLVTTTEYDDNNRAVKVTDAEGGITRTEYDAAGNRTASIDALGRRTEFRYNTRGELTETIFPDATPATLADNPRTKTEYDAAGQTTAQIDELGRRTEMRYDRTGRPTETIYPDGTPATLADNPRTTTEYDDAGRTAAQVDERGNRTAFEYDAVGRQTAVRDALLHETTTAYDPAGRRTAVTDDLGHTTRFGYDAGGRPVETTYADGTTTASGFDTTGRLASKTDQLGRVTRYEYDALGRLKAVVDALQQRTEYGYDEAGNLVTQTDANGHVTRYEYDGLGRRTATVLPLLQRSETEYDPAGQVERVIDFNGDAIEYAYDARGRLVAKHFEAAPSVTFTYTAAGERATYTDARGTTAWAYDERGRLRTRTEPDGQAIAYTYDAAGNRTSLTTAVGTVAYHFDALNRLDTVTDPDGRVTGYGYNAVGNLTRTDLPNGTWETRAYDTLNRLTTIEHRNAGGVFARFAYTLGPTGRRDAVIEPDRSVAYGYDALDRLTGESITDPAAGARTFAYTYDPVGNRLTRTDTAEGSTAYTYDANDRLSTETTTAGATAYAYDANGNTLTKAGPGGSVAYTWDPENRLVGADTDGNGTTDVVNVYDADGIRVSQTTVDGETRFLIDQVQPYQQVALEYRPSGLVVVSYVHGNDLVSQKRVGARSFYHVDGLGSTRVLTGAAGLVTDRYVYEAFGRTIGQTGTTTNSYLFAGEQRDGATGLDYLRARYLNVSNDRFVSRDAFPGRVQEPITLHRYLYANAAPTQRIDPSGKISLAAIGVGLGIVTVLTAATLPGRRIAASALNWGLGVLDERQLNPQEKELIARAPYRGLRALLHAKNATETAQLLFEEGLEDGNGDAFRHAYWNALMASTIGTQLAKAWGDAHEKGLPGNTGNKAKMDLYNNAVGRKLGQKGLSEDALATRVLDAVAAGRMRRINQAGSFVRTDSSGLRE